MQNQGWTSGRAHAAGSSRNYKLWTPGSVDRAQPAPLLMLLHGCTHNAEAMAEISGMNEVAEANRFFVLYPEQRRRANLMKCWNWFNPRHQSRDAGEPAILAAMVEQVCSERNVDRDRIYVAGISAGGAMAVIAAANYPDIFSGVGVCCGAEFKAATTISAGLAVMKNGGPDPAHQGESAFQAMKKGLDRKRVLRMPVIVFQGTADTRVNPVNAGQIIAQWNKTNSRLADANAENGFALSERSIAGQVLGGHAYTRSVYTDQIGRPLMEKWMVEGLGHAWSGSAKAHAYGDPKGPNASAEIWRFFLAASNPKLDDRNLRQQKTP
jgi:poly(hydroxyalkanoate) depolymerase family esterase